MQAQQPLLQAHQPQMAGLMGPFQGLQGLQGHAQVTSLPASARHLVAGARVVAGEAATNPQQQHSSPSLPQTLPGGAHGLSTKFVGELTHELGCHGLSLPPAGGLAELVSIFNRNPPPPPAAPAWAALTLGGGAGVAAAGGGVWPRGP